MYNKMPKYIKVLPVKSFNRQMKNILFEKLCYSVDGFPNDNLL